MDFLDFFSQESLVRRQNNHRHESECPTLPYMTVVPVPYCTTTLPYLYLPSGRGFPIDFAIVRPYQRVKLNYSTFIFPSLTSNKSILKSLPRLAQSMSSDLLLLLPTARLDQFLQYLIVLPPIYCSVQFARNRAKKRNKKEMARQTPTLLSSPLLLLYFSSTLPVSSVLFSPLLIIYIHIYKIPAYLPTQVYIFTHT